MPVSPVSTIIGTTTPSLPTTTTSNLPTTNTTTSAAHLSAPRQKRKQKAAERLQCPQCEKTFTKHNHLTRHQQTHSGDKPFSCSLCEKRYLRISDLKVHLRSHSGERPYVCGKCQKRYITSSHLRMHQRTHADDIRLFECKVCLRTFSSSNGLTQHSYVHQKDAGHPSGGRSNPGTEAGRPMRTSGACASYGVKTFSTSAPPRGGGEAGARKAALATRLASAGRTAAAVPASAATPAAEIPCGRTLCQGQRAGEGAPVAGGAAALRPHENSANAAAACNREAPLAAACAYGLSSRATTATSARSAAPLSAKPPFGRCHSNPVSPIRSPPPTDAATESGCTDRDGNFCLADGLQHLAQAAALLHSTTSIESVT